MPPELHWQIWGIFWAQCDLLAVTAELDPDISIEDDGKLYLLSSAALSAFTHAVEEELTMFCLFFPDNTNPPNNSAPSVAFPSIKYLGMNVDPVDIPDNNSLPYILANTAINSLYIESPYLSCRPLCCMAIRSFMLS